MTGGRWFVTIGLMDSGNRGRNILIGIVTFVVVILLIVYFVRRRQSPNIINVNSPLPTSTSSYQQELQNNFGITVPSNAITADLKDSTGGNQVGLATEETNNGQYTYTVIANLEDPTTGYFYNGWLVRGKQGDSNFDAVNLGKLNLAKGGWIISYTSYKDLSDHKSVWVTLSRGISNFSDQHVLEGSF